MIEKTKEELIKCIYYSSVSHEELKEKYNKLLGFVKNQFKKSTSTTYIYTLNEKEFIEVLKEIGELE